MTISQPPIRVSTNQAVDWGLRWLRAEPGVSSGSSYDNWPAFLASARQWPAQPAIGLFSWLFWLGLINGILAFSGLMVWPDGSGIHMLIFLLVFWLAPLLVLIWTLLNAWWRKRSPWWRYWLSAEDDAVIAAWCAAQSLKAQALYVVSGLAWMWLMLLTRQLIFYWSTSLQGASARVDDVFAMLTLGLLDVPEPLAISASQAGSITGWETQLLNFSEYWAVWLTQVTLLWVVIPVLVALLINQLILRRRLASWPRWNRTLHQRYEQQRPQALHFESLTPEQPGVFTPGDKDLDNAPLISGVPVMVWQDPPINLPQGSVVIGRGSLSQDEATVMQHTEQEEPVWVVSARAVPTGDLADLITLSAGTHKEVKVLLHSLAEAGSEQRINERHSWQGFVSNQELPARLYWLDEGANAQEKGKSRP
ncbi:DUF2868 domain-containing protein [Saccharospirillum impatiens]|uniref:DUF2868 domain-containing protein n=1 Tax=Saccharospirillum impatiens TaxID=169438 RepID=UPI00042A8A3A|nr:DUF2868 domain-containing protein [Saccharospirillum impatiens]